MARFHRGWAHVTMSRYDEAIADFDEVLRLTPDDANVWKWRGDAKAFARRFAEAVPDYDRAIELKADFGEAYGMRGGARLNSGDRAGAIADLQRALALLPPGAPKRDAFASWLRTAEA
jgi:tetratricopeptide (TPR) repeat protein